MNILLEEVKGSKRIQCALQKAIDAPFIRPVTKADQMRILLEHFSEKGKSLKWCARDDVLGRSVDTLKAYCRRFKIAFPDYVPMCMEKERAEFDERMKAERKAARKKKPE